MTLSWGRLGLLSITLLLSGCSLLTPGTAQAPPTVAPPTAASPTAGLPSAITMPSIGFPSPASATAAQSAPASATATGSEDVRKVGGSAAFSSPSGRIICFLGPDGARCDFVGDKAWTAPRPSNCELDWGSTLFVEDTGGVGCVGDTVVETAKVGSEYTTWRRPSDPTVVVYEMTLAVLPYGSGLISGAFRCESATTGVTCLNTTTGHGFTMAREAYSLF